MLYLYEMVEHEGADASPSPLGVCEDEGNICLIVLDIRNQEGKPNHKLPVQHHTAEVWVL